MLTSNLTDTSEDSKLVHRQICTKVDATIFFSFFSTPKSDEYESYCMTQRRVENTRVHFGANSPVSVKVAVEFSKIYETIEISKNINNTKYTTK